MAVYTQLNKTDIQTIADRYEFQIMDFTAMEGGASNSNYLLHSTTGKFMLTVVEDGGIEMAERLAKLLKWLEQHNFFTTKMIPLVNGGFTSSWNGKAVFIKNYIAAELKTSPDLVSIENIGAALARFNQIPAPDFIPDIHVYEQPRFSEVIGTKKDLKYESWLKAKNAVMDGHLPISAPKGIVHGDLFADNVLFPKGNNPIIIDFEEACFHFLVFDLGMAIIGICSEGNEINFEKARALLKGYQKVRPLEPIEKQYLQFFTIYGAVRTSNWRFWKYHIQTPNPERKHLHWVMADIAEKVTKMQEEDFLNLIF
jgi:homoserine kinase type II